MFSMRNLIAEYISSEIDSDIDDMIKEISMQQSEDGLLDCSPPTLPPRKPIRHISEKEEMIPVASRPGASLSNYLHPLVQ
jgi:hypothetical protein